MKKKRKRVGGNGPEFEAMFRKRRATQNVSEAYLHSLADANRPKTTDEKPPVKSKRQREEEEDWDSL